MTDSFRVTLLNGVALVTADVYSFILPTLGMEEVGFQLRNIGTGTPVGLWSFEASNDPAAATDFYQEQKSGTRIGASTTAVWVPIDAPTTVHGDSLTLGAAATQNSAVSLVLGNYAYTRVWYDITSGGTAASLGYVWANARS